MTRRRHTPDQIIRKLSEGNKLLAGGTELDEVCRHLEIADSTWHRWVAQFGGMKADDAKRLKELERENARLKKLSRIRRSISTCSRSWPRETSTPTAAATRIVVLRDRFGVSERRASAVVGQHRSTQRLDPPTPSDEEATLRSWLRAFAVERPRWGWRRAYKGLRREGHRVNKKRVQRLWRAEGLKVPYRKRKKRTPGSACRSGRCVRSDPTSCGRSTSCSTRPSMARP